MTNQMFTNMSNATEISKECSIIVNRMVKNTVLAFKTSRKMKTDHEKYIDQQKITNEYKNYLY